MHRVPRLLLVLLHSDRPGEDVLICASETAPGGSSGSLLLADPPCCPPPPSLSRGAEGPGAPQAVCVPKEPGLSPLGMARAGRAFPDSVAPCGNLVPSCPVYFRLARRSVWQTVSRVCPNRVSARAAAAASKGHAIIQLNSGFTDREKVLSRNKQQINKDFKVPAERGAKTRR